MSVTRKQVQWARNVLCVRMYARELRSAWAHDHREDCESARAGLARALGALGHYKLAYQMLVTERISPRSHCCGAGGD